MSLRREKVRFISKELLNLESMRLVLAYRLP
jgi:hypothetical protein